jgi:CPA1 family monovalent cation:H+ antiporter
VVERLRRLTADRTNAVWERLGGTAETRRGPMSAAAARCSTPSERSSGSPVTRGASRKKVLVRALRQMDLEESLLDRSEDE